LPCKKYHVGIGTPASTSVTTVHEVPANILLIAALLTSNLQWHAGSSYKFSVKGTATHSGGSCQVLLSYDESVTFRVIRSYHGSCPLKDGDESFTIPVDTPNGNPIFAWTWYNKEGNRELYMDGVSVTIVPPVRRPQTPHGEGAEKAIPFSSLPKFFKANIGNACITIEGKEDRRSYS